VPHESIRSGVELARHAGTRHEVAHEDEQRDHRQHVGEAGLEDHLAGAGKCGLPATHETQSRQACDGHGQRQRNAQEGHRKDGQKTQGGLGHEEAPSRSAGGGWWGEGTGTTTNTNSRCTAAVMARNSAIIQATGAMET